MASLQSANLSAHLTSRALPVSTLCIQLLSDEQHEAMVHTLHSQMLLTGAHQWLHLILMSSKGEVLRPFGEGPLIQGHTDTVLLLHRGVEPALHGAMRAHRLLQSSCNR